MKVGIDQIGYFTPNKYVDMVDLAHARNQDPNKFLIGIGQKKMSVADPTQDAVSMMKKLFGSLRMASSII